MTLHNNDISISVCIATFNGEKYLVEQLNSILNELECNDEVIIVDDCSTDTTIEIIQNYQDKRIKLYKNSINQGHVYSFSRAVKEAKNDLLFLSDQDDIWLPERVSQMKKQLLGKKDKILSSNFNLLKNNQIELPSHKRMLQDSDSLKYSKNLVGLYFGRRFYYGCAMAFHKSILKVILPFPSMIQSHDLWIAIIANIFKTNIHLSELTVTRRIHGSNLSETKRSLYSKIKTRFIFTNLIIIALYRRFKFNVNN